MQRRSTAPKGIKDLFYETRVLSGREYTVTRFVRYKLGEGIEKKADDFASEVMSFIK